MAKKLWETLSPRRRCCAICGKTFAGRQQVFNHLKDAHKVEPTVEHFTNANRAPKEDHEPSFASRAIDAELDHAMGVHNDDYDWLVEPYR